MRLLIKLVARELYMLACRLDPSEWHDVTLTTASGVKANFSAYGDIIARFDQDWQFDCSCEEGQ